MNAQPLFELKPHNPTNWREKVRSVSFDERQIMRWIMHLHNHGRPFDADITYSTGRFWDGLVEPTFKFDLSPQRSGVVTADARHLPVVSSCFDSIMLDPPFIGPGGKSGIMYERFGRPLSWEATWSLYWGAIKEAWRTLGPGGLLTVKCQDLVSGGHQVWMHSEIMHNACELGFECDDLFILVADHCLWSPNMANQRHARKTHSYFLVFRKPRTKR